MNPNWDVYGHPDGRFYRMMPQGGRIAEMYVAHKCCVKIQRAGKPAVKQLPNGIT
ncbi:MAG: hypothetical protein HFI54_14925 [Lachnospiraceae bacterium]|nr:hypothetical protein [Lachnospiraceae bacterium]